MFFSMKATTVGCAVHMCFQICYNYSLKKCNITQSLKSNGSLCVGIKVCMSARHIAKSIRFNKFKNNNGKISNEWTACWLIIEYSNII